MLEEGVGIGRRVKDRFAFFFKLRGAYFSTSLICLKIGFPVFLSESTAVFIADGIGTERPGASELRERGDAK